LCFSSSILGKGWPSRKIVVFKTKCRYVLSGRITAVPALWQMFALRSHPVGAGRDPAHSKVPNCPPLDQNPLTKRIWPCMNHAGICV